jgi:peptidoglycan hydrolase-like protein with peptidoglycan-binding domain
MTSELEYPGAFKRPDQGPPVKRVQEWLCLHGLWIKIDGDFGPATQLAMKQYQAAEGLPSTGVLDPMTWDHLVAPLRAALAPIPPSGRTLGQLTVAWASQQLASKPREIPPNSGAFVRTYMKGHEGKDWPWCAGFATFCLEKAASALGVSLPIKTSFSCDELAWSAKAAGILLREPGAADRSRISPGSLFVVRKSPNDWSHTGIVVEAGAEAFRTIEGNTNDAGSANGDGVYQRVRKFGASDFILFH